MKALISISFLCLFLCASARAQMTIAMVPSADTVEKGHVFVMADGMYRPNPADFQSSAVLAFGLGHGLEFDLNGVNVSDLGEQQAVVPGLKYTWKFYRLTLFTGDQVWNPVRNKGNPHGDEYHAVESYSHGNFFYAGAARTFGGMDMGNMYKARITAEVWNSEKVMARGNRTGVALGFEYNAKTFKNGMITPLVDWASGKNGNGYVTPGLMITYKKFMIEPAYMIGNNDVSRGNHMAQLMVGYTF